MDYENVDIHYGRKMAECVRGILIGLVGIPLVYCLCSLSSNPRSAEARETRTTREQKEIGSLGTTRYELMREPVKESDLLKKSEGDSTAVIATDQAEIF